MKCVINDKLVHADSQQILTTGLYFEIISHSSIRFELMFSEVGLYPITRGQSTSKKIQNTLTILPESWIHINRFRNLFDTFCSISNIIWLTKSCTNIALDTGKFKRKHHDGYYTDFQYMYFTITIPIASSPLLTSNRLSSISTFSLWIPAICARSSSLSTGQTFQNVFLSLQWAIASNSHQYVRSAMTHSSPTVYSQYWF